jgi:hypothetical protein
MVVNDLMVQGDRKWDEAKILSYFSNSISNQTLSIPLTVEERNDSLIVRERRMRSGYHCAMHMSTRQKNVRFRVIGVVCGEQKFLP